MRDAQDDRFVLHPRDISNVEALLRFEYGDVTADERSETTGYEAFIVDGEL